MDAAANDVAGSDAPAGPEAQARRTTDGAIEQPQARNANATLCGAADQETETRQIHDEPTCAWPRDMLKKRMIGTVCMASRHGDCRHFAYPRLSTTTPVARGCPRRRGAAMRNGLRFTITLRTRRKDVTTP